MKKYPAVFPAIILLSLLCSCANGNISELLRSYDDPADDTPDATCYEREYTISLKWKSDPCADTFILMRADDDGAEHFEKVYSGTATKYEDTFSPLDDQRRVLYRLDKVRGKKRFCGSDCACAVVSATLHDLHEPNGTMEQAAELERIITATMPCSQFRYKSRAYGDEDWYFIRLKPLATADILFLQTGADTTSADTDFLYMQLGGTAEVLKHNQKFTVTNTDFVTKNIYFKVMPDIPRIFAGTAGASVPSYRMELCEEVY